MLGACQQQPPDSVTPQAMADAIHTVIEPDRAAYTKYIVNKLAVEEQVIEGSEHWQDDKALLLPAQMFRAGTEIAAEKQDNFTYTLLLKIYLVYLSHTRTSLSKGGVRFNTATNSTWFRGAAV